MRSAADAGSPSTRAEIANATATQVLLAAGFTRWRFWMKSIGILLRLLAQVHSSRRLAALPRLQLLFQLFLQPLQIEARALLHRRAVEEGLCVLRQLLLDDDVATAFVYVQVVEGQRAAQPRPFKGIEAEVHQDRPVRLHRAAKPAARLIDEPVLVVADAHRAESGLGEVEDLVTLRRTLAGEQVQLTL